MKEIILTNGLIALVDNEDYERINKYKWTFHNGGYAIRHIEGTKNSTIMMHREILHTKKNKNLDHINQNKLDNRKENLRVATNSQNQANRKKWLVMGQPCSSKYRGVSWHKGAKKWRALTEHKGVHYNLGNYDSEEKAAKVYDLKVQELHGEFAKLNF